MTQTTTLQMLAALQAALDISDHDALAWQRAVACDDNLVAWLHRHRPLVSDPDALGWAAGNPNGFGRSRILATLGHYGTQWPLDYEPLTRAGLERQLAYGRAASLAYSDVRHDVRRGYAPTLLRGALGPVVQFEYHDEHTVYALNLGESHNLGTWDFGWATDGSIGYHGVPGLILASAAARALTSPALDGAGWVAGASR